MSIWQRHDQVTHLRAADAAGSSTTVTDQPPFWETVENENVRNLPDHLKQFVVDQNWEAYTPIDHAVWRYIMRRAVAFHKKHAHKFYFKGLLGTGIDLDKIPRIEEMNRILAKIGWGAVAVDGFIPPAAFMEFQAHRVLPIACEMRQLGHVEYTPAPDIVHEAAGHAPIIVDEEYADYLRRFGEVGAKAMSSRKDFELYEAIRHLSILKEQPDADPQEIEKAEKDVEYCQANLGKPSEMALLSRLHWWTVEYGLIGSVENYKIYGAGLLSSIGEAKNCLDDNAVKKIAYTLDAADYAFDITNEQPHLFVCRDFEHLGNALEDFASRMAFMTGGKDGLDKAIESANVATAEYSSGLQATGVLVKVRYDDNDKPYYLHFAGPAALAFDYKQLVSHGKDYHAEGFSSPVGRLANTDKPLEDMIDQELRKLGIEVGRAARLSFESGVQVHGKLTGIERRHQKIILMTFTDCTVTDGNETLFEPSWGSYDMAVGESIVSVFHGAADKDAYQQVALVPKERSVRMQYEGRLKRLLELYQFSRDIRDGHQPVAELQTLFAKVTSDFPEDWLLPTEIYETALNHGQTELVKKTRGHIEDLKTRRPEVAHLLDIGLELAHLKEHEK
jgi:phenylalanine-4-hydroxylase